MATIAGTPLPKGSRAEEATRGAPDLESSEVEALLGCVGAGARSMVVAITESMVRRFGDRGSCILVGEDPRVVFSTEVPDLSELAIDIARYPEIAAALDGRSVVAVEDVRSSVLFQSVTHHLPSRLGAVVVVPLIAGEGCLGVILAQSSNRRPMAADDVHAAAVEGRLAGTLLQLQFGSDLHHELRREAPGASTRPVESGDPAPALGVARGRILIGEDDREQAETLAAILTDEKFHVTLAGNGAEVVRLAQSLCPDLLLLDLHMPVLDGLDVLEKLATDARTSDLPIVIVSGAEDLLPRMRGLNRDTVDFLRKPFSLLELLARVDRSLRQAAARENLRIKANVDDLTGLGNARILREHLALEQSRISRYGTHSAIVMVDVDKLKQINDRHGHVTGSRVLRAIGQTLRKEIRETDLAARYGGDEFVVLLPHTTSSEAGAFAERVLAYLRRLRPEGIDVSLSMGVAAVQGPDGHSMDRILAQADAAAYRAKRAGGAQVCIFDPAIDVVVAGPDRQYAIPAAASSGAGGSEGPRPGGPDR